MIVHAAPAASKAAAPSLHDALRAPSTDHHDEQGGQDAGTGDVQGRANSGSSRAVNHSQQGYLRTESAPSSKSLPGRDNRVSKLMFKVSKARPVRGPGLGHWSSMISLQSQSRR